VDVGVRRQRLLGLRPNARLGGGDDGLGVVRPGQQEQMERVVVQELGRLPQVPHHRAERRRRHPERHLDRLGRRVGVDAATDAAGPAGDEDSVARIAASEDDLVAPKQGRDGVGVLDPPLLEVDHGMEGQRAGDPCDRVDADVLDVAVPGQQLTDPLLLVDDRGRRPIGVRISNVALEPGAALLVELDRQVLEAHAMPSPCSGTS